MKLLKRFLILLFIAIFVAEFTGCNNLKEKGDGDKNSDAKNRIKFTDIMLLSNEAAGEKIYSIEGRELKNTGNLDNVSNIVYNKDKNIQVYANIISQGNNITKNYISIICNGNKNSIKDKYSYMDLRLSSDGKKIALRSFSEDSPFSAEGLSVYDVYTGKKVDFDNKVIVSGDLYRWNSQNNLLYYGVESGETGYGKIYSYSFEKSKREILFDKFNGYCIFFAPTDNKSFLYMENDVDLNNMYYYDSKDNKSIFIGNTIDKIENYVIDNKNNILYFIGKEANAQESSLYKFNITDKSLNKITYDFPKMVDENGGIAVDSSGKVYFCGLDASNNSNNIYMYLNENNSVNLISNKSGVYYIIQNSK